MRMVSFSRLLLYCLAAVLALGGLVSSGAVYAAEGYTNLDPGQPAKLPERVPVNYVFVGYEPEAVGEPGFRAGLPATYRPIVRSRLWNDIEEYLGLDYTYDHKVVYADSAYEEKFFSFLSKQAKPAPLTLYQQQYNAQTKNVRDVAENNFIDAPTVEEYLAKNAPSGVDTKRNTMYFINWWGSAATPRPGFKHHVYTKFDEPDPDTEYDFGRERDSRKIIAWGGTPESDEETGYGSTRRVWFYDLSAGPESWTGNWNVDDADLDGDTVADYRMPPVWEYFTPGGYRPAAQLAGDLARVARYVGINLLFTSSPIYPPEFTPELLPKSVNLDINTYEGLPGVDASDDLQAVDFVRDEIADLHPIRYTADEQELEYDAKARQCYELWARPRNLGGRQRCYPELPNYPAFANLFLNNALKIDQIRDDEAADRVYEAVFINYAAETARTLGFAENNYRNGTQSLIFSFVTPAYLEEGYGLSTTEIHEYGHHLNLSHPHDGFDFEQQIDYEPTGPLFFAWAGDEHNSMMSYIDLNWDFSQFDRDNNNRFQAAGYIKNANAIAARIVASARFGEAADELREADELYGRAKASLAAHDYDRTFRYARRAYEAVLEGAEDARVPAGESQDGVAIVGPSRAAMASRIPGYMVDKPERADLLQPNGRRGAGADKVVTPLEKRFQP